MVRTPVTEGRERGSLAAVARRPITIKEPAERPARKASLRGGHFNIVQIMRPRQRRTVGRRRWADEASMIGADAAANCA
jgi:hypothetical protein